MKYLRKLGIVLRSCRPLANDTPDATVCVDCFKRSDRKNSRSRRVRVATNSSMSSVQPVSSTVAVVRATVHSWSWRFLGGSYRFRRGAACHRPRRRSHRPGRELPRRRGVETSRARWGCYQWTDVLGDRPSIRPCSRLAPRFRWAMAVSASAQPSAHTVPLNTSRHCRSGAKSSEDCASSISVATRLTPSPVLATETCGFPARL